MIKVHASNPMAQQIARRLIARGTPFEVEPERKTVAFRVIDEHMTALHQEAAAAQRDDSAPAFERDLDQLASEAASTIDEMLHNNPHAEFRKPRLVLMQSGVAVLQIWHRASPDADWECRAEAL